MDNFMRDQIRRDLAERARRLTTLDDGEHVYLSTACRHDECGSCRETCKFCPARCICECHRGTATTRID